MMRAWQLQPVYRYRAASEKDQQSKTSYSPKMGCKSSLPKPHSYDVFTQPPLAQGPRPEVIKLLLVVNPYSGGKKGAETAGYVEEQLRVRSLRRWGLFGARHSAFVCYAG